MRILLGLTALVLALVTGYLAVVASEPAFAGATFPPYAGQLRGIAFTVAMAASTVGLLWLAVRFFAGPRTQA